ncbi:MAG: glucose-6-phosphate isomerase, partial [Clostridia bacterium]|nr:glucose-6-phosphate isomerase [Clostridia bacterium]
MAFKFSDKYLKNTVTAADLDAVSAEVAAAAKMLDEKSGAGADFLGWVDLPVNYDREEAARIDAAAKKICDTCDALIVIGIGGSYLGAR